MSRLIKAEFRKVFTTKLWWGMLLGALALTAIGAIANIASAASGGGVGLDTQEGQQRAFSSATSSQIFILLVGIIGITTEYRHFTSRPTFLDEPRRGRVIAAKFVALGAVGALYAVSAIVITLAVALPWFSAKSVSLDWGGNQLVLVMLGTVVGNLIFALVGVGIGVVVRNQIAAVIGALAYFFVIENLISIIPHIDPVYRLLPGAAASAITDIGHNNSHLLHSLPGALVFLAWGAAFALAGWYFTVRRDID